MPTSWKPIVTVDELGSVLGEERAREVFDQIFFNRTYAGEDWRRRRNLRVVLVVAAWIKAFHKNPRTREIAEVLGVDIPRAAKRLHHAKACGLLRSAQSEVEDFLRWEPVWELLPQYLRTPRPYGRELDRFRQPLISPAR